jgi:adenylate cyclase
MRYALVYLDGAYLLEAVVLMAPPVPQLAMIPASTAADMLRAVGAPMLVFLAISGVFRIDSAAAVLSAAAAVVTYAIVAHALAMSLDQSLPAALVVAFTGAAGVVGARVIRDAVVRAGEARILEHYVPRALLGDLRRSGSGTTGREEQVSVIFVDIRGFTSLVEHLTPSEAVAFLNAYLGIAMPALLEHGAIVDKYLGDGILAFIEGKDNVNRAVAAGLAVLDAVARWNETTSDVQPVRVGVAVHAGRAMLGSIGPPDRRDYTIISDAVNVTSRLEELNKHFRSAMIISGSVAELCGQLPVGFLGPETVDIRGHAEPMQVYHLPPA